jgi:large subunit ribosomal protein L16
MKREPAKLKHRKWHKRAGLKKGKALRGTTVDFGEFGLKALEGTRITYAQMESARVTIARFIKKQGKMWIRLSPDKPITTKPVEVGMGKGKGAVDHYVRDIRAGKILFELSGIPEETAREAIKRAGYKLPVKVAFVTKN